MHVAVRRDRVADPTRRDELAQRIALGVLPLLGASPGFFAGCVVALDGGEVACFHLWFDRVSAAAGVRSADSWIGRHVHELVAGPPEVGLGEMREFEIGASGLLEFAGQWQAATRKEQPMMAQTATPTTDPDATQVGTPPTDTAKTQPAGRPGARVGQVAELTLMAPFRPNCARC